MRIAGRALLSISLLLLLVSPVSANAPKAMSVSKVDGRVIILVAYDDGVVSFDGLGEGYHKYDFKPARDAGSSALVDFNLDQAPDFAAMGKPSFVLGADANPRLVLSDGCADAFVADFVGEKELELFCRSGDSLAMYGYDGSMLWELGISGMKINRCRLVDLTGNGLPDFECELSSKQFLQIGANGSIISESSATRASGEDLPSATHVKSPLLGDSAQSFDFDEDGKAEEKLVLRADGADVVGPKGVLASIDFVPISAAFMDIDKDKVAELVLLGNDRLVALSKTGVDFDVTWQRAKMKRSPAAELMTVGGRNLKQGDTELRAALESQLPQLASCYSGRVKKNPYLGVGRMSLKAKLNDAGAVTDVEKSFSTLNDTDIESCVIKAVKKLSLIPGKNDEAHAIFDIEFGYRDR